MIDLFINNRAGFFPFTAGVSLRGVKRKYYFELLRRIFAGDYPLEHVTKCYCGCSDLEILSAQERFALPFGTKICISCGLIQLSPRICAKSLPNFYNEIYYGLILGGDIKELSSIDCRMARNTYELLRKDAIAVFSGEELKVIDIGCGSGVRLKEMIHLAKAEGIKLRGLGCDYSRRAVEISAKKNIDCRLGGVKSLEGEKADIVILSHVIEHFVDIKSEFESINKLMKKGSYLYIEVPGVEDLVNRAEYGYDYLLYSVMAHIYNFNLASLRSVVEPLGFEFISGDEYIRSVFRFNPGYRSSLDLSGNYKRIISALESAEKKRRVFESMRWLRLGNVSRMLKNAFLKG